MKLTLWVTAGTLLLGYPAAWYMVHARSKTARTLLYAVVVSPRGADPTIVAQSIQAELKRFDPALAAEYEPASQIIASTLGRQQLGMTLMVIFGATAVALAAVGVYGAIAYAAAQRRHEVGVTGRLGCVQVKVQRVGLAHGGGVLPDLLAAHRVGGRGVGLADGLGLDRHGGAVYAAPSNDGVLRRPLRRGSPF